jgi:hypothetical protein
MADPAERVSILRDRVEEQEKELEAAVRELKVAARRMVGPSSPSEWVRRKPVLCVTGALALGWWLGSPRRRSERRHR